MPDEPSLFENRPIRLTGDPVTASLRVVNAVVEEGLSHVTQSTIDFLAKDRTLDLTTVVGAQMNLDIEGQDGQVRRFRGMCVAAEYLGAREQFGLYQAEVRSWAWFLGRNKSCRVFQNLSTVEIVEKVLADRGFSARLRKRLSRKDYPKREFCLQFRETDLDFLSRLMEQDGIYFYFVHDGAAEFEVIVLADDVSGHDPSPKSPIDFIEGERDFRRDREHVFEWTATAGATTGRVVLQDYDFEKANRTIVVSATMARGNQPAKEFEEYLAPGGFRTEEAGKYLARVRMEAEAARFRTFRGVGNVVMLAAGQTFKLDGHDRSSDETEFLLTRATHYIQVIDVDRQDAARAAILNRPLAFGPDNEDMFRTVFEAVPKNVPYRAPLTTSWPEVAGIHTALVVGPAGEEIYTDKYGRVCVQFFWDREGQRNEKSSVFVRTMMPWTGKGWGMIAIPRIGQEVVVQFENGNPDRPVVVGMLYASDTMPPYALPENMTQTGIKTRSTKEGTGFNELVFEDKIGAEFVRFQSERDYTQIVKNDAKITVGVDTKSKGDMSLTVHRHLSETVATGDHTFKVETGSQIVEIKTDKTEKIEGKSDLTVTGNVTETVKLGNVSTTVEKGNVSEKLKVGNLTTSLDVGNIKVDVALGKIEMSAMQEISFTVGPSKVVINPGGVTIQGPMIKVEGTGMVQVKAPMVQVNADGLLTLKGAITLIN